MVDTRFSVSVHIMVSLAYHQDDLVNSDYLAKMLKTNPTFVRKLVSKLVDAKLINSFRGKNGGIKLAKDPQDITLKDIYCAIMDEKCLLSTHKKTPNKSCLVSCSMESILSNIVEGIENSTKNYLTKITLRELLKTV